MKIANSYSSDIDRYEIYLINIGTALIDTQVT
jgi:hypothetical protein